MAVSRTRRRVFKTRQAATRPVPPVVAEWAEDFADMVASGFAAQNTGWEHDSIPPSSDPHFDCDGGYVRKTDQQLQRMDIHIHSSIAVTFESPDCLAEFIFNLRALAEELTQVADSLQSDGEED